MARLKSAQFDERMTLVEHLDELRTRIIVSAVVLVARGRLLLLAEPRAARDRQRAASRRPRAAHLQPHRALLHHAQALDLRRHPARAADPAVPDLRLRAPGVQPARERGWCCRCCSWCRSCSSPAPCSPTSWSCPRRSTSCSSFNADQFNIEVRANEYYGFFVLTLIGIGLLFQIPVGVLAVTRLGIVTPQQLAQQPPLRDPDHRRGRDAAPGHRPGDDADLRWRRSTCCSRFSLQLARFFGNPGEPTSRRSRSTTAG